MEDEGNYFHAGSYSTWEDAKEALDELTDNDTGFFSYVDYAYLVHYPVGDCYTPAWWPDDCKSHNARGQ
jgi:hypothetical protein